MKRTLFAIPEAEHLFPLIDTRYSADWLVGADLDYWTASRRDDDFPWLDSKTANEGDL